MPVDDPHPEPPVDPDAVPLHARPGLVAIVALGGAVGATLRYALARALPTDAGDFPAATFLTNVGGAFLLGILLETLARLGPDVGTRRTVRLALGTGVLGAFTTYSALAVEVTVLGRDGHAGLGAGYGLLSAVAGFGAAAVGIALGARRGGAR